MIDLELIVFIKTAAADEFIALIKNFESLMIQNFEDSPENLNFIIYKIKKLGDDLLQIKFVSGLFYSDELSLKIFFSDKVYLELFDMLRLMMKDGERFTITKRINIIFESAFLQKIKTAECKICLEHDFLFTYINCKHFGICPTCYQKLDKRCPFCRRVSLVTSKDVFNKYDV